MPEFWLDANSLILPYRGPFRFETVPQFWDFLRQKAQEGVIGCPDFILEYELTSESGESDALQEWAKPLKGVLFVAVDASVQAKYNQVVEYAQNSGRYKQHWIATFLDKADPWIVAYPMALGGRIVTFETPQPQAKRPKIPDIAQHFGIKYLTLWDMLTELGFKA